MRIHRLYQWSREPTWYLLIVIVVIVEFLDLDRTGALDVDHESAILVLTPEVQVKIHPRWDVDHVPMIIRVGIRLESRQGVARRRVAVLQTI